MSPYNRLLRLGFLSENLGHDLCLILIGNSAGFGNADRDPFGALMLALELIS